MNNLFSQYCINGVKCSEGADSDLEAWLHCSTTSSFDDPRPPEPSCALPSSDSIPSSHIGLPRLPSLLRDWVNFCISPVAELLPRR